MMQNASYLCIAKRVAGHGVNSNRLSVHQKKGEKLSDSERDNGKIQKKWKKEQSSFIKVQNG